MDAKTRNRLYPDGAADLRALLDADSDDFNRGVEQGLRMGYTSGRFADLEANCRAYNKGVVDAAIFAAAVAGLIVLIRALN